MQCTLDACSDAFLIMNAAYWLLKVWRQRCLSFHLKSCLQHSPSNMLSMGLRQSVVFYPACTCIIVAIYIRFLYNQFNKKKKQKSSLPPPPTSSSSWTQASLPFICKSCACVCVEVVLMAIALDTPTWVHFYFDFVFV